jgi:hypothetical protein
MFEPTTFEEVCMAMHTRAIVKVRDMTGTIQSVAVHDNEDNGRCWLVTLSSETGSTKQVLIAG